MQGKEPRVVPALTGLAGWRSETRDVSVEGSTSHGAAHGVRNGGYEGAARAPGGRWGEHCIGAPQRVLGGQSKLPGFSQL